MNQIKTAPHGLVSARKKNIANRECMNISHSNHDVIFFLLISNREQLTNHEN